MGWSSVLGHDSVKQSLSRAASRGRLAHAYLFVGPSGIGKRRLARQFAKTLFCEKPPDGVWDSCDKCAACLLVEGGTHPDMFSAERPKDKHEFPIDVMQQFCSDLGLKPARGTRKFAILDDADDLNEESANCFLKTLEEPPPGSILVLLGTIAERQLATIRSRCQVMPFSSLTPPQVEQVLKLQGEIPSADVARLARIAGGSPGLARELADPQIWECRCRALDAIGNQNNDFHAVGKKWWETIEAAGKDSSEQRQRASLLVRLTLDGLRAALNDRVVDSSDSRRIAAVRQRCDPERLTALIERCLAADVQIEPRRIQLVLVIEALMDALQRG